MEAPQDEFSKKKSSNLQIITLRIKKEWNAFPKDLAANLVQSMKNRISDVIANKGDFIMY